MVLIDIPDNEVEAVIIDFESEGANKVIKKQQMDGKWTVLASFVSGEYNRRIDLQRH